MDRIVRIWVFACIILFSMRQFLPRLDRHIDVVGLFGIAFVLLILAAAVQSLHRLYRTNAAKRSVGQEN